MTYPPPPYGRQPSPPPSPYGHEPAHAPKPAWYKKTGVIVAAAAVVALLVGVGIGGSGKSNKAAAGATVTATSTVVSTAPAPPAGTVTLKPTVIKTVHTETVTKRVVYTPAPKNVISDGTYQVGPDVPPGTYRTEGGADCYYAILNSTNNQDIAQNDNFTGPEIVTLYSGKYFEISGGCTWSRK